MIPGVLNIVLPKGTTLAKRFELYDEANNPIDLTGYEVQMAAKKSYSSTTFLMNIATSGGTTEGTITVTGNRIDATVPWATTDTWPTGVYLWNLELTSPADKRDRLLEGNLTVNPGVL